MPVIGNISAWPLGDSPHLLAAIRQGLKDTGFVEGQNVAIECRFAEYRNERAACLCEVMRLVSRARSGLPHWGFVSGSGFCPDCERTICGGAARQARVSPRYHANTPRHLECTRHITVEQVRAVIRTIPAFSNARTAGRSS